MAIIISAAHPTYMNQIVKINAISYSVKFCDIYDHLQVLNIYNLHIVCRIYLSHTTSLSTHSVRKFKSKLN